MTPDHYSQGMKLWDKRGLDNLKSARSEFVKATQENPNDARAYAALADCHIVIGHYEGPPYAEAQRQAEDAANKALGIDADLGVARQSLGLLQQQFHWDWSAAEENFKRAVKADPSSAKAHHWYAGFLSDMGRHDEAIAEIKKAIELEPKSVAIRSAAAFYYLNAERYEDAIKEANQALALNPSFFVASRTLGFAHLGAKDSNAALDAFKKSVQDSNSDEGCVVALAYCYAVRGEKDKAVEELKKLGDVAKSKGDIRMDAAAVHAALDQEKEAIDLLESCVDARVPSMTRLKIHPGFSKDFRKRDSFAKVLRKMGFPG